MIQWTLKQARRLIVAVIGGTVLIAGVIMIVTPGPAVVVIPLGLGILATEFVWARHLLHRVKDHISKTADRMKNGKKPSPPAQDSPKPLDNGRGH